MGNDKKKQEIKEVCSSDVHVDGQGGADQDSRIYYTFTTRAGRMRRVTKLKEELMLIEAEASAKLSELEDNA